MTPALRKLGLNLQVLFSPAAVPVNICVGCATANSGKALCFLLKSAVGWSPTLISVQHRPASLFSLSPLPPPPLPLSLPTNEAVLAVVLNVGSGTITRWARGVQQVETGKIRLLENYTVTARGKPLNAEQSKLLVHLGLKLVKFQVKLLAKWSDGQFAEM